MTIRRWTKLGLACVAVAFLAGGIALYSRRDQARAPAAIPPSPVPVIAAVAPFDGVTGIRLLDVGNIIQPTNGAASYTTGVVVVTQVQPISVIFTLPMDDIPGVQDALAKGPLKTIAFSQDGKTQLDTGQLLLVDNQADPTSGTVRLKALFPNPQRRLWPGTFVNVRLVTSVQQNGLTVPLDARKGSSSSSRRPGSQSGNATRFGARDAQWRGTH